MIQLSRKGEDRIRRALPLEHPNYSSSAKYALALITQPYVPAGRRARRTGRYRRRLAVAESACHGRVLRGATQSRARQARARLSTVDTPTRQLLYLSRERERAGTSGSQELFTLSSPRAAPRCAMRLLRRVRCAGPARRGHVDRLAARCCHAAGSSHSARDTGAVPGENVVVS